MEFGGSMQKVSGKLHWTELWYLRILAFMLPFVAVSISCLHRACILDGLTLDSASWLSREPTINYNGSFVVPSLVINLHYGVVNK